METPRANPNREMVQSAERYKIIEARNNESFLMTVGSSLQVVQSIHSTGVPRDELSVAIDYAESEEEIDELKAQRKLVDGNMSPVNKYGPSELSVEERIKDAKKNLHEFLYQADIEPIDVRMLKPERSYDTPITAVNVDETPLELDDTGILRPTKDGDVLYTFDPNLILAARPADCPLAYIEAQTPNGMVTALVHLAWRGVGSGHVQQAKAELDKIGIDWSTAQVQITGGGHAKTFIFEEYGEGDPREQYPEAINMFVDVEQYENSKGETLHNFLVDVAAEAYEQIVSKWGVDEYNVFADTTDTTAPESGYSSHSRSFKDYHVDGDNTRDLFLARRERFPRQNPNKPAPIEVLENIKSIRIKYIDFDGDEQIGTIEIHTSLVEDVKKFFELAKKLKFPIQRVVKSSDEQYGWNDDLLMADNATTAFNYRFIKGTERPSLHGLGRALDINDALNPYIRYLDGKQVTDPEGAVYDPQVPGTLTADHPLVVLMKKRGWSWGGDWTEENHGATDYQHFEKPATS
jgi:peptidoglycan L-alanyl-D-glutamate endopeptidase CwlK